MIKILNIIKYVLYTLINDNVHQTNKNHENNHNGGEKCINNVLICYRNNIHNDAKNNINTNGISTN